MVYLRDQTARTPSLANLCVRMTPPGTPLHFPITWILPPTRPDLRLYLQLYLHSWDLHCCYDRNEHAAAFRSRPLSHLICRHDRRHNRKFHTIQQFQIDSTQVFRLDLNQVSPTWFNRRFLTGFDSVFLTWFDSRFLAGFNSPFFIQFDSRLTHLFYIRVTSFKSYYSHASGSPTLSRVSSK